MGNRRFEKETFQAKLGSVTDAPRFIAAELRSMAAGRTPYGRFTYTSPWIKNIWITAAEIIEHMSQREDR